MPTVGTDVPIATVFLVLFIIGAVTHMTFLQLNRRRHHKFILSGLLFGFCMARIVSNAMRIAWAAHPTNVRLAIAAMVFVSAGVVLLFVVNIIFAQRILRAADPSLGWHKALGSFFRAVYALMVVTLIMIITVTVQSFYTLNPNTKRIDRNIQLYGGTYFAVVAFIPIPMVIFSFIVSRRKPVEHFGVGSFHGKMLIVLAAAVLLTLGATFRVGTSYLPPRPWDHPGGYHSKACFYIFNFVLEILVVYLYAIVRVDLRFHVPNGASGPGDYSGPNKVKGGATHVESEEKLAHEIPSEKKFEITAAL